MDFTPTDWDEDAYMQKVNLDKRYTKTWKVSTVNVVAEAHHRSVYIEESSSSPPHNVSTMRDLAAAIEEACLFVEECNPNWSSASVKLDLDLKLEMVQYNLSERSD